MCIRAVETCSFVFDSVPNWYKTQGKYDEDVDDFLPTINFVPDWPVTSKTIKKPFTALYADENIIYVDEDFCNVVFICNEFGFLNIDHNCINLDNDNFDKDDLVTIVHVRILAWCIKFEKRKALKKELNEELIPVAWDWC